MKSFEQLFPSFISSCVELHDALMPAAMVLLVLSFAFLFWSGPPHPMDLVRHLIFLFLVILLLTHSHDLINEAQSIMDDFVKAHVPARPENVAEPYKEQLAQAQGSKVGDQSWWDILFGGGLFESIIYAILVLISWLAMILNFYISILSNVILLVCWVLSPILFSCFVIPPVAGLALRHVLRIVGILSWPLGLAIAASVTDGLLGIQTDLGSFASGVTGSAEYVFTNLLAVATIALWIVFSTFLAPAVMQRLIAGGAGPASLVSRAGEMLANMGLPLAVGAARSLAGSGSPSTDRGNGGNGGGPPPPLITLDPSPGSSIDSPTTRPLSANDPTLGNAVRQAMEPSNDD